MRAETEPAIRAVKTAQQIADSRDGTAKITSNGTAKITSKGGIDTGADVACENAIRLELKRVESLPCCGLLFASAVVQPLLNFAD